MANEVDIVIIGAGAAGLAAARQVVDHSRTALVLEARDRIGGRAWTVAPVRGQPIDLGCGWLHSADRNLLVPLARRLGFRIDESVPEWDGRLAHFGVTAAELADWARTREGFHHRVAAMAAGRDQPASACLPPSGRWNALLGAISTWANGAALGQVSAQDLAQYSDTGINWRTPDGYGRLIAFLGTALPIRLAAPVSRVDWTGPLVAVTTPAGTVRAKAAIVAVPTAVLAAGAIDFQPGLPPTVEAAIHDLPLGHDEKLYFQWLGPEDELPADHHVVGALDQVSTGAYQTRPHGRPLVEVFVGGDLARGLALDGTGAFEAFAREELGRLYGSAIQDKLVRLAASSWTTDPWTRGSYSHARIGRAGARATLTTPIDERLFFAGEATHPILYSTAHGAYLSGLLAAERALLAVGTVPKGIARASRTGLVVPEAPA